MCASATRSYQRVVDVHRHWRSLAREFATSFHAFGWCLRCIYRLRVVGASIQKCLPSVAQAVVLERSFVDRFHVLVHGRTLPFEQNVFRTFLSIKASRDEHINKLEGHAFLLLVHGLLRRTDLQATRIVLLCDSTVWKRTKTKGRSSSSLNSVLRRCAALEMPGDIAVYVLLVPSVEMPADIPSRGKRWRNVTKSSQPIHVPQSVPHSRVGN